MTTLRTPVHWLPYEVMETLKSHDIYNVTIIRHVLLHCLMVEDSALVSRVHYLLKCLEEVSDAKPETPVTTCIVIDRALIVLMFSRLHQSGKNL